MKLSTKEKADFLHTLKLRFEKYTKRHQGISWDKVLARLKSHSKKILILYQMEISGGEPDVLEFDKNSGEYIFYDCAAESPTGRRSLCYDREGLESRKEHQPKNSALDMAAEMGVVLLNEEQYKYLQQFGPFDTKTSSWIQTPTAIRKLGGALFGDFRYGQVFIYHNGAPSYYASRGFRALLRV
jgi:hypothetical protein